MEENETVTEFSEAVSFSVCDAQGLLEGRPCVIHSHKNDIQKFRRVDKYMVESYESEAGASRELSRESPITKYVQMDSHKSAKQIKDLTDFKNNMQHIMKIVKNGERLELDQNAFVPAKKKVYKELSRAYDSSSKPPYTSNTNISVIGAHQQEQSNRSYDYEDMCYEGNNIDMVQRKPIAYFSDYN